MQFRLIIVEPHYQLNIGYMARIAKNFGIKRLWIVNPACKYSGKTAIKYSKHARDLVENAKVCSSIGEASKGFMRIGTTAIWRKAQAGMNNIYELSEFKKRFGTKNKRLALVIGRDTIGLTREELESCDASIFIRASDKYPTLNISHALAILLYALRGNESSEADQAFEQAYASSRDFAMLERLFDDFVDLNDKIRKKDAVKRAFAHIVMRSYPTKREIDTLLIAFTKQKSRKR